MATPSSSPQPPPPPPPPAAEDPDDHHAQPSNPSSPKPTPASPLKKIQPLPWTHQETVNLIQAYQEKWYSLKRGQLKANQWEEVAITVAARCGYDEPSKSAIQCRHKIEKLRKRYRAEKLKPHPNSSWHYFELMHRMEHGPLPISAQPMAIVNYQKSNSNDNDNEDSDDEVEATYSNNSQKYKSESINHIVREKMNMNKFNFGGGGSDRVLRVWRTPMNSKRKEYYESDGDDEEEEEVEEEGGSGSDLVVQLATEIRGFAERFVRIENKKIEMMKDTERFRMEMENKRMEMILESQRKIVNTIGRAFESHKKMRMAQEI